MPTLTLDLSLVFLAISVALGWMTRTGWKKFFTPPLPPTSSCKTSTGLPLNLPPASPCAQCGTGCFKRSLQASWGTSFDGNPLNEPKICVQPNTQPV